MASALSQGTITTWNAGLDSQTFRGMLMESDYTHDTDSQFVSQISADEWDGSSYTRQDVAGMAWAYDAAANLFRHTFTNVNFGSPGAGTLQITGMIIYSQTGGNDSTEADDSIYAYVEIANRPGDGTPVIIQAPSTGIFTIAA